MDVLNYIPQRGAVVMVDSFYGVEGSKSCSGFRVPEGHVFVRDGVLDECGLVENMAQSAALMSGWEHVEAGREVPLGFIGAVERCEFLCEVRVGDVLHTEVEIVAELGGVMLVEARVGVGGCEAARCRLKIFLQR